MCVSRKTSSCCCSSRCWSRWRWSRRAAPAKTLAPNAFGAKAYTYVDMLSRITNPDGTYTGLLRQAGTPSEVAAAEKIAGWFGDAGYMPAMQPFTYVRRGVTYNSQNVVAFRPADQSARRSRGRW